MFCRPKAYAIVAHRFANSMERGKPYSTRVPMSLSELRRRRDAALNTEDRKESLPSSIEGRLVYRSKAERLNSTTQIAEPLNLRPHSKRPRSPTESGFGVVDALERDAIRRRYMPEENTSDAHDHRGRPREKNRFKFDWDAEEDTFASITAPPLNLGIKLPSDPYFGRTGKSNLSKSGDDHDDGSRSRKSYIARDSRRANNTLAVRHWSEKSVSDMSDRDWAIFREDNSISYRGMALSKDSSLSISQHNGGSVQPARNWNEAGLPAKILRLVLNVAAYRKPTPIQMASIPIVLGGRDMIGLAETGSGKTAAFVLPMIAHILQMPPMSHGQLSENVLDHRKDTVASRDTSAFPHDIASDGPYALVLAPTRELVLQIEEETRKFAAPLGFRVTAVIGGQGLEEQGMALQAGSEIVICTPGRMVDLLSRRLAALGNCNYLVLDEADRMVDMGFEAQVQEILMAIPSYLSEHLERACRTLRGSHDLISQGIENANQTTRLRRQTLMFSATMSPAIERIAREYLSRPIVVTIGQTGKAAEAVQQHVEVLSSEGRKRERLVELVSKLDPPIIVFANTKKGCEDVARLIESRTGIRPVVLHSGKSQEQREEHLEGFRSGRFGVVVATDVLGRGIDIKGVNHVINFELPKTIAPYTHRIGRTGRAGRKGTAWSLATGDDADLFADLKVHLEQSGAPIPRLLARHDSAKAASLRPIID
jgi:ATP-dependent RNA helicase DDX23/PRP28